jgi:hypothetical protein
MVARPDGAPVTAFSLLVLSAAEPLARDVVAVREIVDPEGRFDLAGLPEGPLVVVASGQGWAATPELTVPQGDPATLEIELGRGATLVGRVVQAGTRRPLEHARVSIEQRFGRGATSVPIGSSVVTSATGTFELPALPPGTRSVHVAAAHHHRRLLTGLELTEGAVVGPVEVELEPTRPGESPTLELAGIGAVLKARHDVLLMEQILAGGGAQAAGLAVGDEILAIDGTPVGALGFEAALQRIRGAEGTTVVLSVRRAAGSEITLTVTRRRVRS